MNHHQHDKTELLKEISDECKTFVQPLEIVTPPIFSEIFSNLATKYEIDHEEVLSASSDALKEQVDKFLELNEQSARQIDSLDSTSNKALQAMRENDAAKLQESIDETEALRREIEKLKESVYKDGLTRTWNRKWLEANYLDDSGAFCNDCVVAIVDLNYFKQVNDTLGHIAGDKVLQFISAHLKETGAPVVRYGGDEFVLLFTASGQGVARARKKMQICREELLQKKLKFSGKTFKTSFSYGIAEAKKGAAFTDVVERADKHLYQDKEAIKQRVGPPFS
ncbi:GGDEF domain-containing protein [Hydrogenimonas sp.]